MAVLKSTSAGRGPRNGITFISKKDLLNELTRVGTELPPGLLKLLKTPTYMKKGFNGKEFFDVLGEQPSQPTAEEQPVYCYKNRLGTPSWIKRWYIGFHEEEGTKKLVFIYAPKKIFVMCNLENAMETIAAEMFRATTALR